MRRSLRVLRNCADAFFSLIAVELNRSLNGGDSGIGAVVRLVMPVLTLLVFVGIVWIGTAGFYALPYAFRHGLLCTLWFLAVVAICVWTCRNLEDRRQWQDPKRGLVGAFLAAVGVLYAVALPLFPFADAVSFLVGGLAWAILLGWRVRKQLHPHPVPSVPDPGRLARIILWVIGSILLVIFTATFVFILVEMGYD